MVNCPPLLNSKRCFKASTQIVKLKLYKLAGLFLPRTAKLRTARRRLVLTDGLVFDMDVKNQNRHGRQWFQAEATF
ncbi:hypothetical protein HMPREF9554_01005 [Treponema phagedenis F0421]|nr:hypothetical protein HMPREF9554_01005 [Treponema phagedenis F0421]